MRFDSAPHARTVVGRVLLGVSCLPRLLRGCSPLGAVGIRCVHSRLGAHGARGRNGWCSSGETGAAGGPTRRGNGELDVHIGSGVYRTRIRNRHTPSDSSPLPHTRALAADARHPSGGSTLLTKDCSNRETGETKAPVTPRHVWVPLNGDPPVTAAAAHVNSHLNPYL